LRTTALALVLAAAGWTADVRAACTILASAGPAFGTYDPVAARPLDAAGSISYTCTPRKPAVWLSTGSSGTYAARTLRSGANVLRYNLYLDAARTVVWGDGSGGTSVDVPSPAPVNQKTIPVYGRVAAGQDAAAGTYSDTIVVTFAF
ncbi:MAG TPA: spore coat U domain-containing protein, partial [Anaeromyxobacteraceae bacterium]|nr:spore coat U domain-containing protein [Anaeromyxobacteraceae bacterium]